MIENMTLTSYSDVLYLLTSRSGYVATIQIMSCDKLKHQVSQQLLSYDMTFMSHRGVLLYHDCRTQMLQ